ncbi:MAG: aminopeptidase N [Kiritimatiellia bacterium]|jgi:aminopeptidase N
MPVRHWDLQHLDLAVRIDPDAGTVKGTATHSIAPLGLPHETVHLDQVALNIQQVLVDGTDTPFRTGRDWLEISVAPGVEHTLVIHYEATPQTGLHFRSRKHGDAISEAWSQGEGEDNRHWFPSWDYPSDRFTLTTHVTAPRQLLAVANGALEGPAEESSPGWRTWNYDMKHELVNYLVMVAVGDYVVHKDDSSGTPQEIWVRRGVDAKTASLGFGEAGAQVDWLGELVGAKYPYSVYRQIVVQRFLYGGMENSTTTVMSDGLLVDAPWKDSMLTESVTAHEAAHQWFGDLITCYGWRELWLNEGFATYYARRWMQRQHGEEFAATQRRRHYFAGLNTKHPMAARSWSKVSDDRPNSAVYVRGSTVLHMLEAYLGRDVYDRGIRLYVASNTDRLVETQDLRRAMEDASGQHLGWFFDQWVYRHGAPDFSTQHHWKEKSADSPAHVEVVIEQTTKDAAWTAPVDIEIGTQDGIIRRRVWLAQGKTTLLVDVAQAPRWVLADPDLGVLARWTRDLETSEWIAILRSSKSADARLTAAHALAHETASDDVVDALREVLIDPNVHVDFRAQMAGVLGKLGTDNAGEALLNSLDDNEERVRKAVIGALGDMPKAKKWTTAIQRSLQSEGHSAVRAAALGALAKLDDPQLSALAKAGLRRGGNPERIAAARALGTIGDTKDLKEMIDLMRPSTKHGVRMQGAQAAVKIATKSHKDKTTGTVSRALDTLLSDPDLRVRRAAISLLSEVGDSQSAKRLIAFAHETSVAKQAESAKDAARAIRHRTGADSSPRLPDDLERLSERLEELQRRLRELETRP